MKERKLIGRVEKVSFPTQDIFKVPARIDTGARTSAIWASNFKEKQSKLSFTLFAPKSPYFTGQIITTSDYSQVVVASSMGHTDVRYRVKLPVILRGKKIQASFTLADRSRQAYPILVGRNILRGKFVVDVKLGKPISAIEKLRSTELQLLIKGKNS